MTRAIILAAIAAAVALAEAAPSQAPTAATKIENPFRGVMQDRSSRSPDEALFVQKCAMCHRQMGMGTVIIARRLPPAQAMLEQRTDLTADMVIAVARNGMGNMPRIPPGEVSDEQLARIGHYLETRNAK